MNQLINKLTSRIVLAVVLVVASAVLWLIPGLAVAAPYLSLLGFGLGTTYATDLTDQGTPSDHKIRDVSMDLTWLRPSRYPLDTILRRADVRRGMERATQIKVEWEEDDSLPRADTVNGATTAGAAGAPVNVTVDNGSYWRKDDLVYIPGNATSPGGVLYVSAVNGNVLTVYFVTPGGTTFGTVPAFADAEAFKRLTNAKQEQSNASDSRVSYPGQLYNLTQIFDAVVAESGTKAATKNYTQRDRIRSEKQALYDLRQTLEYAAIFGDRALISDPTTGKQRAFMGGITYFLSSNDLNYTAGSLTEANIIDFCRQLGSGNAGSSTRYWFATPNQTAEIDKILASTSTLRNNRNETQLGVQCKSIETSFLKLYVFNHQGLAEMGKTNWGLIIDPAQIRRRPLRPMRIKDIEDKDVDGTAKQWLEESSLEVRYEATHAVVRATATDSFS